jgi:16S rRNA pseudouridine516 synthase
MDDEKIRRLENGVDIGYGCLTQPARAEWVSAAKMCDICHMLGDRYRERLMRNPTVPVFDGYLTITEGKKHQVKRMLKAVGCCVVYLKRVSIGELQLDDALSPGEYRPLTDSEREDLCRM